MVSHATLPAARLAKNSRGGQRHSTSGDRERDHRGRLLSVARAVCDESAGSPQQGRRLRAMQERRLDQQLGRRQPKERTGNLVDAWTPAGPSESTVPSDPYASYSHTLAAVHSSAMANHSQTILELARRGAQHRYEELQKELGALVRQFPDLTRGVRAMATRGRRGMQSAAAEIQIQAPARKRRKMPAAARAKIAAAQRARWAKLKSATKR